MKNALLIIGVLAAALLVNGCGSENEMVEEPAVMTEAEPAVVEDVVAEEEVAVAAVESVEETMAEPAGEVEVAVEEVQAAVAEETEPVVAAPDTEAAAAQAAPDTAAEPQAAEEVDPDAVAVTVNGQTVTEKDIAEELNNITQMQKMRMPPGIELPAAIIQQMRKTAIENQINNALLRAALTAKGADVSEQQIQEELEKIAGQKGVSMEQMEEEIVKSGLTLDNIKGQLRHKIEIETMFELENPDSAVTEADAKKFYDENPQHFVAPEGQIRASHILCGRRGIAEEEYPAELEKIEAAKARLDAGEAFEDVAKDVSSCPSSAQGGDLGFFGKGSMDPAFEKAAFELEAGQTSGIVKSSFGYHIIKRTGDIQFEDVEENITQYLTQQKQKQFWDKYKKTLMEGVDIKYSEKEQAFLAELQKAAAERAAARQAQVNRPATEPVKEADKAEAAVEEK